MCKILAIFVYIINKVCVTIQYKKLLIFCRRVYLKIVKMLELIGRTKELFLEDIQTYEKELSKIVSNSTFLVIGGAGSIG